MADKFDPYREALVVEQLTHWPVAVRRRVADWSDAARRSAERRLQSDPASAAHLEYVRVHTGFCRRITVTEADLDRLGEDAASEPSEGERSSR